MRVGLASQMFSEIFSHSFLTPLEDSDIKFRIGVSIKSDSGRFTKYLAF